MIEQAEDDDHLRAEIATIEAQPAGCYLVRITRADGVVIPINCESAASAAELIRELKPPERFISIPEGPARDAILFALGDEVSHSKTLH